MELYKHQFRSFRGIYFGEQTVASADRHMIIVWDPARPSGAAFHPQKRIAYICLSPRVVVFHSKATSGDSQTTMFTIGSGMLLLPKSRGYILKPKSSGLSRRISVMTLRKCCYTSIPCEVLSALCRTVGNAYSYKCPSHIFRFLFSLACFRNLNGIFIPNQSIYWILLPFTNVLLGPA